MSWCNCGGLPEPARADLIRHFTLASADEAFVRKFRGPANVLGATVRLCTLPWPGFVPDDVAAVPAAAVARLSERLGIPVGELHGYGAREQTRFLAGMGRRLTAQNLPQRAFGQHLGEPLPRGRLPVDVLDEVLLLFDHALSGRQGTSLPSATRSC